MLREVNNNRFTANLLSQRKNFGIQFKFDKRYHHEYGVCRFMEIDVQPILLSSWDVVSSGGQRIKHFSET